MSNISGDHGEKLFLALDGGTVSDTLPSVTYKAVLKVDGTEYNSVSAARTNTTYQASVLNGSFEAPDLTNHEYQEFVPEGTAGLFWKTTGENTEGNQHVYGGSATAAMIKSTTSKSLTRATGPIRRMQPTGIIKALQRTENSTPRSTPALQVRCIRP